MKKFTKWAFIALVVLLDAAQMAAIYIFEESNFPHFIAIACTVWLIMPVNFFLVLFGNVPKWRLVVQLILGFVVIVANPKMSVVVLVAIVIAAMSHAARNLLH